MSKLNQLRQLSESHPVYFFHMYQKELQRAESRNNTDINQTQEDQPEVEGEWTESEFQASPAIKEANPKARGAKTRDTVSKGRGKAVHSRP